MKRSQRWFSGNAQQDTTSKLSTLTVLARTGPDNASEPTSRENNQGVGYFKVGVSEVEGEDGEVVV
jgi:hypothetical protein